jgi:uncharacterized protein (TIGR00255 family)
MIQSMTGYGKSEILHDGNKLTIELRSVNGKSADINIKTAVIPREREIEVKQIIAQTMQRGSIDLFASIEYAPENSLRTLNKEVFAGYLSQIREVSEQNSLTINESELVASLLRFQDVFDQNKKEVDETLWESIRRCLEDALKAIGEFRSAEGSKLAQDLKLRTGNILEYLTGAEQFEGERVSTIRQRFASRLEELSVTPDENRMEQEIIYYIEKLDITEEKVRLRQHCKYFIETMETDPSPGKKLGFIAQEMGREINTLGSKANHAGIQKFVVQMKDELEKIKEQTLNIL